VARAQQGNRVRRVGVLMNLAADDAESQTRYAAFLQALGELGWTVGRNLRIDIRWGAGDAERYRKYATELHTLAPDVIVGASSPIVRMLQQTSRTVPTVFVQVSDPVGAGFIASLARPGGNITGFAIGEFGTTAKWLELLKQIAPSVTRVAVLRDSTNPAEIGQLGALQSMAPSLRMELSPLDVHDADEIERAITAFARGPNGGLVVTAGALQTIHRDPIITLAARYRLPAVYFDRVFITEGGLIELAPEI
jgi:putative ABC transport system substrate-binding protein